jgi:hypothetical protein
MQDTAIPKKMYGKLYATRRRGRPKMRWLDDVSMDLRKMGLKEWKDRARNRGLEAHCRGGQGSPRAVAPSGRGMTKTDKTHAVPHRIYGEDIPTYNSCHSNCRKVTTANMNRWQKTDPYEQRHAFRDCPYVKMTGRGLQCHRVLYGVINITVPLCQTAVLLAN